MLTHLIVTTMHTGGGVYVIPKKGTPGQFTWRLPVVTQQKLMGVVVNFNYLFN